MIRRIAIIAPNYHPRTCGVGDHSMRMASELRRRGVEVAIFTRDPVTPNPEAPELAVFGSTGTSPSDTAEQLLMLVLGWRPTELVVQYTPQMLNASRFGSPAIPRLVRLARRAGLPVTIVAHEVFTPWALRPDLALGAIAHRLMLADLLRSASSFAVTTEARRRRISGYLRVLGASEKVRVIRVGPNALPSERPPARSGVQLGAFSTMTVGKRFDLLLEAFAVVGREEPNARLTLIGDLGRVQHRGYRALLAAIRSHMFGDRIVLTGKLPLAEVSSAVGGLTVFFHPDEIGASTRSGTLPLALGAGVPVVAFRGVETDPIFLDGENVLFVERSATAIGTAVMRVLREAPLVGRLAAGGRRLYEEHLAWPRIVSALIDPVDREPC